jgi:hypothetical protein
MWSEDEPSQGFFLNSIDKVTPLNTDENRTSETRMVAQVSCLPGRIGTLYKFEINAFNFGERLSVDLVGWSLSGHGI